MKQTDADIYARIGKDHEKRENWEEAALVRETSRNGMATHHRVLADGIPLYVWNACQEMVQKRGEEPNNDNTLAEIRKHFPQYITSVDRGNVGSNGNVRVN